MLIVASPQDISFLKGSHKRLKSLPSSHSSNFVVIITIDSGLSELTKVFDINVTICGSKQVAFAKITSASVDH